MCGFAGHINKNLDQVDPFMIKKMMQLQQHRGPDDSGLALFSLNEKISLSYNQNDLENLDIKDDISKLNGGIGFNRLSVIDVSKNGHQPMANKDNTIYIMFNGEIYNAFQLKNELIDKDYNFKSKTDTEIILFVKLFSGDGFIAVIKSNFSLIEFISGCSSLHLVDVTKINKFSEISTPSAFLSLSSAKSNIF